MYAYNIEYKLNAKKIYEVQNVSIFVKKVKTTNDALF